jgi:hypothetical protein
MNKIIKNTIMGSVMFGLIVSTGCISTYNHGRVKENLIKENIVATGNAEQIKAVNMGIKPSTVLKIVPTTDGKGAMLAFSMSSDTISYFKTFAEAPVSSSLSLLADGGIVGGLIWAIGQISDNGGNKSDENTTITMENSNGNNINVGENNSNNGGGNTTNTEAP